MVAKRPLPKEEVKIPPVKKVEEKPEVIGLPPAKGITPPVPKEVIPEVEKAVEVPPPPPPKKEVKVEKEIPPVKKVEEKPEVIELPPVKGITPPAPKEVIPEVEKAVEVPPPPKEVTPPRVEEVIIPLSKLTNSDFKDGLTHWKKIDTGPGKKEIGVIKESMHYPNVLEFKRTMAGKEKGRLGVNQQLNMDISEYVYVVIKADVKVIYASLKNDGDEGGDYPVTIELEYEDAQENIKSFKHGFLYQKQINYPIGECISRDKWYSYTSPNLMDVITPKPRIIKGVKIYGSGLEFKGRVANLELICKEVLPLPEIPVEVARTPKVPQKELLPPETKIPEVTKKELLEVEKILPPVQPAKMLANGNFTLGLQNWEKIETGKGINKIGVMKDSDEYPNVLEFTRVATEEGKLGISQSLWMPVDNFISLTVMADIKVIYSSFFGDKFVERGYPLVLEIEYIDMEGKTKLWKKGFKYQGKVTIPESEEMVKEKVWYPFTSINLIKHLSPKPKVITKMNVYGWGWGFWVRITNIQLIGE